MTNIYLNNMNGFILNYEIPEHLQGIKDTEEQRKIDLELLDKELRENGSSLEEKISSGIIWRRKFPGMILDVKRITLGRSIELSLKPIHPHRADLAYKKDKTLERNVSTLTANALLESAEGSFILGIRGGSVEAGKIAIIPGGHVDYTTLRIENPLETFRNEFHEELGYEFDGSISLVSMFTNRDTKGINFLYTAKTGLDFPRILEKWKTAKDREEHGSLFQASYKDIKQLAETGKKIIKGKEYSTTPFIQDCLNLFIQHK